MSGINSLYFKYPSSPFTASPITSKPPRSNTARNILLDVLEKDGMIRQKRDTKKTALSLVNYGVYQNRQDSNRDSKKTLIGRRSDTDRNKQETIEDTKKKEEEKKRERDTQSTPREKKEENTRKRNTRKILRKRLWKKTISNMFYLAK